MLLSETYIPSCLPTIYPHCVVWDVTNWGDISGQIIYIFSNHKNVGKISRMGKNQGKGYHSGNVYCRSGAIKILIH